MVTVKELKDWLDKFPDWADVEYRMDCVRPSVHLIAPTMEALDLDTGKITWEFDRKEE